MEEMAFIYLLQYDALKGRYAAFVELAGQIRRWLKGQPICTTPRRFLELG